MKLKKTFALVTALSLTAGCMLCACSSEKEDTSLLASYSFDESVGNVTKEKVSGKDSKISYVFNEENADKIFKAPNDPLRRKGVKGNSLYFDGYTTSVENKDFTAPKNAVTLSAWVAPRVFENLVNYESEEAKSHPRLTSVINKGDIDSCEGFVMGYGRLGVWGVQLALYDENDDEQVVGFYDPANALPLYEWSHLAVSFDGSTGYIGLFYNGEKSYEAVIPELAGTRIISSEDSLYLGKYSNPMYEFGVERQMVSGLLDEVKIYGASLSPVEVRELYADNGAGENAHPSLEWSEIALDSSVLAGDRYRPQYHALPPAMWMNEPHAPFYYNGKYHVFYQHNPNGPYWAQLRWGHIVSDDMVHWTYVKDAVVPTAGICPEGVWTGGACIGPDGTPWLVITAGTNTANGSGQNIAFAHAKDPADENLTEWVLEDKVVIAQPNDGSQGEVNQFRDPFVWKDGDTYYMLVSTSVPNAGGSANIYISQDMREWEYQGYLFECDYELYPEAGEHWECVIMLPISTKDGETTKYVLFNTPQYTGEGRIVECYYWIGTFDKAECRFIPDNEKPTLFDCGRGIYTGQNGFCFSDGEGKTYEQGRSVLYAIAQGKDGGTEHNVNSGWAHNFAIPLEIWLSDDGTEIIREPVKELQSLRTETLYELSGTKNADELNAEIADIRGDMLEINATFTLAPTAEEYSAGLSVRYNPTVKDGLTEHTDIIFSNAGVYIDRLNSSLLDYVTKSPTNTWENTEREYTVTVLMDRSMLEVYINGVMSFTTRIYPKYGDSDHLHIFDGNAGISFTSFTVYRMGSAYSETVTDAYYGNVGNLG